MATNDSPLDRPGGTPGYTRLPGGPAFQRQDRMVEWMIAHPPCLKKNHRWAKAQVPDALELVVSTIVKSPSKAQQIAATFNYRQSALKRGLNPSAAQSLGLDQLKKFLVNRGEQSVVARIDKGVGKIAQRQATVVGGKPAAPKPAPAGPGADVSAGYPGMGAGLSADPGQRYTVTDTRGTTTYSYDAQDRVAQITQPDGHWVGYDYDDAHNRTILSTSLGGINAPSVTEYDYNNLNQLTDVTDPNGQLTTLSYDPVGMLDTLAYPNGLTETYDYNDRNFLTDITLTGIMRIPWWRTMPVLSTWQATVVNWTN